MDAEKDRANLEYKNKVILAPMVRIGKFGVCLEFEFQTTSEFNYFIHRIMLCFFFLICNRHVTNTFVSP